MIDSHLELPTGPETRLGEVEGGFGAHVVLPAAVAPMRLRPETTDDIVRRVGDALSASTPAIVVVRGEAGAGKTTLVGEAIADLVATGAVESQRVIRQASVLAESELSLVALDDLAEALRDAGVPTPADETDPNAGVAALGALWRRRLTAAAGQPLVLVLDDVQWLDTDSADALAFALRRVSGVPLAVLATERIDAPAADPTADATATPWPGVAGGSTRRDEILLEAPAPARLADAVADLVPGLDRSTRLELTARAHGNVFWARELVRLAGADPDRDVDPALASPIARERLHALAGALSPETRHVLALVQLAGRPTTGDLLTVLEGAIADPSQSLEQAERAGAVIFEGQRWTPTHPLLGEACLRALPRRERERAVGRLAERAVDAEQRARLLVQIERPPHEPTAALLEAAATSAAVRGSLASAVDLAERAVLFTDEQHPDLRHRRAALLIGFQLRCGDFAAVLDTAERLPLEHLPAPAFDAVAAAIADAALLSGGHAAAQTMIAKVEVAAGLRGDRVSRAIALALQADRDFGTAEDKLAVAEESAAVLESVDWVSPATHMVLGSLCTLRLDRGQGLDRAVVDRRRTVEVRLRSAGLAPPLYDSADALAAYVGKQFNDPAGSRRQLRELIAQADRLGEEFAAFGFRVQLATAHHMMGEFAEAGPVLREAQRSLGYVPPPWFPALLVPLAYQALADDGPAAALEVVQRERAIEPGGPPRWRLTADFLAGAAALLDGRPGDALPLLLAARDIARELCITEPSRRHNVDAAIGEAHLALGDLDAAAAVAGDLLAYATERRQVLQRCWATRILAGVDAARGRFDDAAHALTASAATIASTDFRIEHARTLVQLGVAERRRGHDKAAAAAFDHAETLYRAMPFRPGLDAVAAARAAGPAAAMTRLTPAERQVAELVVAGASARAAAEQLHISHRTVEAHLRAIYRKLGVRGRVGLVAHALRDGLGPS